MDFTPVFEQIRSSLIQAATPPIWGLVAILVVTIVILFWRQRAMMKAMD